MPQRATDERSRWPESVFTFPESVFNLPGMRVHLRPESVFKIIRNTQADAICDRLLHDTHRIELKGPSMRRTKAAPKTSAKATP